MRIVTLTLLLLISSNILYGQSTVKGLDSLNNDAIVQLTRDSHDSWVDWANDDESIFFISPESGNNNLYQIQLNEIELTEVRPNIFAASYIIDSLSSSPITQLTFEDEIIVESPLSIPETNSVAFITYKCDPYPCEEFGIKTLDLNTNEVEMVLEETSSIFFYDFIDDDKLIYVTEESDSTIMELNLSTGVKASFASIGTSISGLNIVDGKILIGSESGVFSLDTETKESEIIYFGQLFGSKISKVGNYLIGILPGPASGMVNLESKETTKFIDSYDYQPSVSNNNKFVAIISEGAMGILIKALDL
jgi:hypothetical protein